MHRTLWRVSLVGMCMLSLLVAAVFVQSGHASAASLNRTGKLLTEHPQNPLVAFSQDSGQCTKATPAVLIAGSAWYVAWIGCDASSKLNIESVTYNGTSFSFSAKYTFGATKGSGIGPALAYFEDLPAIAWVDTSGHVNTASVSDQGQLIASQRITGNVVTNHTPAMVALNGTLYVAWAGTDSPAHLNFVTSTTGVSWSGSHTTQETTVAGPAMTVFQNQPYVAWDGTDANRTITTGYLTVGQNTVSSKHSALHSSTSDLGMANYSYSGDRMKIVFSDFVNQGYIYEITSTDRVNWTTGQMCAGLGVGSCTDWGVGAAANSGWFLMVWEVSKNCHCNDTTGNWTIVLGPEL